MIERNVDIRIIENVHGNILSIGTKSLLDPETPQQTSNADEGTLLRQRLAYAYAPAPAKGHVTTLVGEWALIRAVLEISPGIEPVRIREIPLVAVDRP